MTKTWQGTFHSGSFRDLPSYSSIMLSEIWEWLTLCLWPVHRAWSETHTEFWIQAVAARNGNICNKSNQNDITDGNQNERSNAGSCFHGWGKSQSVLRKVRAMPISDPTCFTHELFPALLSEGSITGKEWMTLMTCGICSHFWNLFRINKNDYTLNLDAPCMDYLHTIWAIIYEVNVGKYPVRGAYGKII